ncbi:MAG: acyl-CoA thioesterase [Pirellulales bacterium]|nr:acyl-CoA thioesterase [Pirellulales bacterium]
MSRPFRHLFRVRYGECDAQKIVFNARYGDYADFVVLEYFRALGFAESVFDGPLDYQVAKLSLEWQGSARFDQVIEASVPPAQVGNTSFTVAVEFRLAGEEQLVARAEIVYVLVDAKTLTKTRVPDDMRKALERGAAGVVVDQSGRAAGDD